MQQWHFIINACVEIADIKIQKMAEKSANNSYQQVGDLIPFKKRNQDEI